MSLLIAALACRPAPDSNVNADADNRGSGALMPTKPLMMMFVDSSTAPGGLHSHAEKVGAAVEKALGHPIRVAVLKDPAVIEAFGAGTVQIAFMGSAGYADAFEKGARIKLTVLRQGQKTYRCAIFAHADSGIRTLADCAGKTFAYRSVMSTAGYIFPMRFFRQHNITLGTMKEIGGGHENPVLAVYKGDIDLCASYWSDAYVTHPQLDHSRLVIDPWANVTYANGFRVTADALVFDKAGNPVHDAKAEVRDVRHRLLRDYPDVVRRVRIVTLTDRPIENDGVVFADALPKRTVAAVVKALKDYVATPEGLETLNTMYNIDGFADTTDDEYEEFRRIMKGRE